MQLHIDDKTGQLTVASALRAANVLRAAATVERLMVAARQLDGSACVAEELDRHAEEIVASEEEPGE